MYMMILLLSTITSISLPVLWTLVINQAYSLNKWELVALIYAFPCLQSPCIVRGCQQYLTSASFPVPLYHKVNCHRMGALASQNLSHRARIWRLCWWFVCRSKWSAGKDVNVGKIVNCLSLLSLSPSSIESLVSRLVAVFTWQVDFSRE